MSATREQLQDRLATLKQQREQAIANANALSGAIQVVESILKDHFDDEEKSTPANPA